MATMAPTAHDPGPASKVPQVTLAFWLVKIAATTLGETGGDAVTMSWLGETTSQANAMGYLAGTGIFSIVFCIAVGIQLGAKDFHPARYWFAIIASTMLGTTLADYATRSLGIGYAGGSVLLLVLTLGSLFAWKRVTGTVAVGSVRGPVSETFYWLTIICSQTLGTALGDWVADSAGFGYPGAAALFGSALAVTAALWAWSRISRSLLFWIAFVLTRPLGAVVGDLLDKPVAQGGLDLSRYGASATLLLFIVACIIFFPRNAAPQAH